MKYIIFDLEATCWSEEDKNNDALKHIYKQNEIIEIGAVAIDEQMKIIGSFDIFVKPTINPILSQFCKDLTHIDQEFVDRAKTFDVAVKLFEEWCGEDVELCSWGFYDKKQLTTESEIKRYNGNIVNMLKHHISVKHQFGSIKKIKPCGTRKALNILGLNFDGTQHRAIYDAQNIAKVFIEIFKDLQF